MIPATVEGTPSAWVTRFAAPLPQGATVLDLACGSGRHVRWLAARGLRVTAVDRKLQALEGLRAQAEVLCVDLETGAWPLPGRSFDAVVVTHYLWRPLLPQIVAAVAPGGRLIYETFAIGQERFGRPSNPDFLLAPAELLDAVRGQLQVLAYEDGELAAPPRRIQRIAAWRLPDPSFQAGAAELRL